MDVLSDLSRHRISPCNFRKLYQANRWCLAKRVTYFAGRPIDPLQNVLACRNCGYKQFHTEYAVPDCIRCAPHSVLEPQSGNVSQSIMTMTGGQEQNVKFSDQKADHVVNISGSIDKTRMMQDSNDATLQNFFSRPIKIREIDWSTSVDASLDFHPWDDYFDNARVTNRLSNYNLLRARLHLKFMVNGNSFLYGRVAAMYQPMSSVDSLTNKSSLISENFVSLSQMPKVFINPTESSGGEMVLPFFWPKNYLNVPKSDWDNMGSVIIKTINSLKHANDATEAVTISVFAWAEDVQLSVLTSVDTDSLSPQSGEVDEANKEGSISGPATRVANVASTLSKIPAIAPYAMATAKVAGVTAQMAKLLGYSRPNVTKDPSPYRPTLVSSLATTTTPDGAVKLTVDDKQELSIDPSIAGVGSSDPMDICSIAQRESYLTKFSWPTASGPETLLWNARIDPATWAEVGTPKTYYFPACAMASIPFRYWTGTMNFRFQVVGSGFHRGRLKIVYDPNYIDSNEYNTNYVEIVDITEKSDFTISIGNGQERTFLEHHEPGIDAVTNLYSTTKYAVKGRGNGVLGVYIVNQLTTPNSVANNDIEVNVYVSMGDDFEVAVPYDHFQKFVLKPQSGSLEEGELGDTDSPFQETGTTLGPTLDPKTNMSSVYMGEAIKSFRPLLKRYALHEVIGCLNAGEISINGVRNMFPYARGNVLGAVHTRDSGGVPTSYNYCNNLLFHWVTTAHSGFRGSMRYKIIPRSDINSNTPYTLEVERYDDDAGNYYAQNYGGVQTFATQSEAAASAVLGTKTTTPYRLQGLTGFNGLHRVNGTLNPACEFEVPFYSDHRFIPGKVQNYTTNFTFLGCHSPGWVYRAFIDGETSSTLDVFCACGEDFTPYFFTGLPPMYFENVPPAT